MAPRLPGLGDGLARAYLYLSGFGAAAARPRSERQDMKRADDVNHALESSAQPSVTKGARVR